MVDELNPSKIACAAHKLVVKEIELLGFGKDIRPFKGKHGKVVEMYVGMMVLEHIIAYLAEREDPDD